MPSITALLEHLSAAYLGSGGVVAAIGEGNHTGLPGQRHLNWDGRSSHECGEDGKEDNAKHGWGVDVAALSSFPFLDIVS
jgi:hypothetical protein